MGRSSSGRMGHLSRKAETLGCEEALCGNWDKSIPGRMNGKDAKLWGGRGSPLQGQALAKRTEGWSRMQSGGRGS